ncbi:carbohydrate ABC transporter permease [Alsobacter sp. SYSU BS001988]
MTTTARVMQQPLGLKIVSGFGLALWLVIAAFPLFWTAAMSFKEPLDAFSSNPWHVILGESTRLNEGGLSILGGALLAALAAVMVLAFRAIKSWALRPETSRLAAWLIAAVGVVLALLLLWWFPLALRAVDGLVTAVPGLGVLGRPLIGFTAESYRAVWVDHAFYRQFINSMIVTGGVVTVSLTVGTLAGYALARTKTNYAFWLLLVALVFRAMPHSVLVAGYLPAFINSRDILAPLWANDFTGPVMRLFSDQAPTLYGKPWAVIAALVAINQPFTIWMLRSFFANIPAELDEAARVDGCSHFEAFWRVIIPVMWPGVITTGLFSFLLAYNDYLVTGLLLDAQSLTMVPMISQFLASDNTAADQLQAIAAAVSITAPLFVLVLVFQRHLVGGLTQGAVKG